MSELVNHADRELRLAGLADKGSDYGGMLYEAIMKMVRMFANEGHSGASANMATDALTKLLNFEPLTPLTGDDSEWNRIGSVVWQNNRCPHVFKGSDGRAYDSNAVIFRNSNGDCFSNKYSRRFIQFPYTPKTEYVDVVGDEP